MSELFADDYPQRTEARCGMSWIVPVSLVVLGLVLVVVVFRLWKGNDPPG